MDPDGVSDASQAIVAHVVAVLKEDQAPVEDEATKGRLPMSSMRPGQIRPGNKEVYVINNIKDTVLQ